MVKFNSLIQTNLARRSNFWERKNFEESGFKEFSKVSKMIRIVYRTILPAWRSKKKRQQMKTILEDFW